MSLCDEVVNVMDFNKVATEFELHLRYNTHFRTDIFENVFTSSLPPPCIGGIAPLLSFDKYGFGIKKSTKVIYH